MADAEPESDHFCEERGLYREWLWCGNHGTEDDALCAAAQYDDNFEFNVKRIKARIELEPGYMSDKDPYLYVDPDGPWEFWQVWAKGEM